MSAGGFGGQRPYEIGAASTYANHLMNRFPNAPPSEIIRLMMLHNRGMPEDIAAFVVEGVLRGREVTRTLNEMAATEPLAAAFEHFQGYDAEVTLQALVPITCFPGTERVIQINYQAGLGEQIGFIEDQIRATAEQLMQSAAYDQGCFISGEIEFIGSTWFHRTGAKMPDLG